MRLLLFILLIITSIPVFSSDTGVTFYCSCPYSINYVHGKKATNIDADSCGFESISGTSITLQREHIVPVSIFAKDMECWTTPICTDKNGKSYRGRSCCLKTNPLFKKMYYDENNIRLVIGEINRARSNYEYGDVVNIDARFGACDVYIDRANKTAQMPKHLHDEITSIEQYMIENYGLDLE